MSAYTAAVLADSPASYWRMDDTTTTMADTQAAVSGTYTTPYTQSQPSLISSDADTCVLFSNGRATAGLNYGFPVKAAFTAEAWVKNTIVSSDAINRRFVGAESASLTGWCVLYNASTTTIAFVRGGGTTISYTSATVGATFHVVATYDGTSMRLYINGALVAGPTASAGSIAAQSTNFTIACQAFNTNNPFNGNVDEVAVYTSALSAARVLAHYSAARSSAVFLRHRGGAATGTVQTGGSF